MGKLELIIDKLNEYLIKRGLQKIPGTPMDLDTLYESALRSIWKQPDVEKRENMAIEIASALRKYFGGKNLEEVYRELIPKLNAEEEAVKNKADQKAREEKLKDPNYVPSFDELFDNK
ncbi:MAG: hypothetical protein EHM64_12360 [Ignavibacteriae bacterium]|nr:MAG: hypothetical protein EHM64_12360 [Ignavibacteriota bacterium]